MQDHANSAVPAAKRIPWNKGKLTGAKPPLRQKHVWAIRTKLQIEQRTRDLALFNLAILLWITIMLYRNGCPLLAVAIGGLADLARIWENRRA